MWVDSVYDGDKFAMREITKRSEDLQKLRNVEKLDRNFLQWFRTSFHNQGKSLIDLP
ncbi:MAG: hypothetical protein V7K68_14990 [Nostoc sp.]|uniref:hypothetical protein n=1 Tax=Nostoc sp. TaxID=1180 RepID=UPI002FFC23E6